MSAPTTERTPTGAKVGVLIILAWLASMAIDFAIQVTG